MEHQIRFDKMEWEEGNVQGFMGIPLINEELGSVKIIKVSPKASYPLHRHPDKTEYTYVIEGNLEFEIDSDEYQCKEGDFFIFPVGKRHAIRNNTNKVCMLLIGSIMIKM